MVKKILILSILLGMFITVLAAEEVVRVRAQGVGATFDEAVRSACRTAVGHVTGTICKERTEIKGDAVKQQILTLSSGFVTSYVVESSKSIDNGIEVVIMANVLREKLENRIIAFSSGLAPLLPGEPGELPLSPREKQRRDFTRMLIYLLDDYVRIFQVIPVNKVVSQYNGKPCIYVNFYLVINPQDHRAYFNDLQKNLTRMGFRKQKTRKTSDFCLKNPSDQLFCTPAYKIDNAFLFQYYNFQNSGISHQRKRQLLLEVELLSGNGEKVASGDFRIMDPIYCENGLLLMSKIRQADRENPLQKKCTVRLPLLTMDEGDQVEQIRYSLRFDSGEDAVDCHSNRGMFVTE